MWICRCGRMYNVQFHAASPACVDYAASEVMCPRSVFQSLVIALVLSRLDYCYSVLVGLPASLIQRLQSVQNAAARLIYSTRRSEHITDALISLHWLRVQEQIVAVLTYRAVHGTAPPYLSSELTRVADVTTRRTLRSSSTDQLIVPSHRLSTVGATAFPVAGAYIWNGLPADVTSAPSLPVFIQRLKTVLFHRSYPNIICSDNTYYVLSELCFPSLTVVLAVFLYLGHFKKFYDDDDDDVSKMITNTTDSG